MTHLSFNRPLFGLVLLTFCVGIGCSTWRAMPAADVMSDEAESLVGKRVRLHTKDGVQEMTVSNVESPYIEGISWADASVRIRVHLREVQRLEVYGKSAGAGLSKVGRFTLFALLALFFLHSISR